VNQVSIVETFFIRHSPGGATTFYLSASLQLSQSSGLQKCTRYLSDRANSWFSPICIKVRSTFRPQRKYTVLTAALVLKTRGGSDG